MKPTILALDLEGTLISNAVSQIPRPGLHRFLEDVRSQFEELVLFTTVPEALARRIAGLLAREGSVPAWFVELRYIHWSGRTKDLSYVSPHVGEALLLDDHGPYVHDGQERLWVEIPLFGSPYSSDDDGLQIAAERLTDRIIELQSASDLGHMIADHGCAARCLDGSLKERVCSGRPLAHSAQLGISTRAALEKLFDSVAPENPETANQRLPAIKSGAVALRQPYLCRQQLNR